LEEKSISVSCCFHSVVDEGINLTKQKKIYITFQLEKDLDSNMLYIKAVFDPTAPNIEKEKDTYIWKPTFDEIDLLNEVFSLLPQHQQAPVTPTPYNSEEEQQKKDAMEVIEKVLPAADEQEEPEESKEQPQEEQIEAETKEEPTKEKQVEVVNGDGVLVAADDKTIDEIVKRKKDGTLKEASEDSILEKILRQKKRGEL